MKWLRSVLDFHNRTSLHIMPEAPQHLLETIGTEQADTLNPAKFLVSQGKSR